MSSTRPAVAWTDELLARVVTNEPISRIAADTGVPAGTLKSKRARLRR